MLAAAAAHPTATATTVVAVILSVWAIGAIEAFLIPLVFALLLLALVNALDRIWRRIGVPRLLATATSAVVIGGALVGAANLVVANGTALADKAPQYAARFNELRREFETRFVDPAPSDTADAPAGDEEADVGAGAGAEAGAEEGLPDAAGDGDAATSAAEPGETADTGPAHELADWLAGLGARVDVARFIRRGVSGLASVLGNTALVLVYLFFLLLERRSFARRLQSMVPDDRRRAELGRILSRIDHDVSAYLGMKTVVSLMTAIPSWAVMTWVGLDFAELWALLILALNFIPNVGSLVATLLPSTLAILQFDTFRPFFVIAIGVTAIQLVVANFIEPPFMGKRLNMSPLVVIVSLVAWSMLWGLPGAFLCVPMTAMLILVLGNIPQARWLAALLSADGRVGPEADAG